MNWVYFESLLGVVRTISALKSRGLFTQPHKLKTPPNKKPVAFAGNGLFIRRNQHGYSLLIRLVVTILF